MPGGPGPGWRLLGERTGRLLSLKHHSILVLEDDDTLRGLIVDTLVDHNYTVLDAATPEQAVSLFAQHRIDLLLTDVRMAGFTDGLGVLAQLKQERPTLRTIVITGYTDLQSPAKAMACRADDYLFKGDQNFGVNLLLEIVQRVLATPPTPISTPKKIWESLTTRLRRPKLDPSLQATRTAALRTYYIGASSGHFTPTQGASYWDALLAYFESAPQLETLTNQMIDLVSLSYTPPPALLQVQHALRSKRLTFQEFQHVPGLLLDPQSRQQSAYHHALHQLLKEEQGPKVLTTLPPWLGRARHHIQDASQIQTVESLTPVQQEKEQQLLRQNDPILQAALNVENGQLTRPWPDWVPTLQHEIERGALPFPQAWAILRPIAISVAAQHQQGRADGFLSPDRLVDTPEGYRLCSFGATEFDGDQYEDPEAPFSIWHADLGNLQNGPQPANDQFSLAVILLQLLRGEDDPLQMLWSRYHTQTGHLQVDDFQLPKALEKMLQIDASARFGQLSEAIAALDQVK